MHPISTNKPSICLELLQIVYLKLFLNFTACFIVSFSANSVIQIFLKYFEISAFIHKIFETTQNQLLKRKFDTLYITPCLWLHVYNFHPFCSNVPVVISAQLKGLSWGHASLVHAMDTPVYVMTALVSARYVVFFTSGLP